MQVKGKRRKWGCLTISGILIFIFLFGNWSGVRIYKTLSQKGCFQLPADIINHNPRIEAETVRFLAMGDAGTGDTDQRQLAETVRKTCKKIGCDFILYLGDNFYPHGVSSLDDPLFRSQFEDIYQLDAPFYAVLGNHDVQGDIFPQLYYSLKNPNWKMGNLNYNFTGGSALFSAVNTNCALMGLSRLWDNIGNSKPWWFVFGHHTIYGSGIHGDTNVLIRMVWRLFFHNQVDFYISGHDHELEHLNIDKDGAEYIVSGAGGRNYRDPKDRSATRVSGALSRFKYQDNGFVWFRVNKNTANVRFFDFEGQMIYQFTKEKNG